MGCPPPKAKAKSYNIDTLIEVIYKTACGMDSIRGEGNGLASGVLCLKAFLLLLSGTVSGLEYNFVVILVCDLLRVECLQVQHLMTE